MDITTNGVVSYETKRRVGMSFLYLVLYSLTVAGADYHWEELWRSLVSLLDFLANKLDVTLSTRSQQLVQEVSGFIRLILKC